jgi:hypothetical protein
VPETIGAGNKMNENPDMKTLRKYLPYLKPSLRMMEDVDMCRIWDARFLAFDVSKSFKE